MSTKPKRKYGDIRPGVETSAGTNDEVFDKFLSPVPSKSTPAEIAPLDSAPVTATPVESAPAVESTSTPLQNVPAAETTPAPVSTPQPVKRGYLKLPHEIIDNVLPTMRPGEQVAYVQLYRLSHGFGKATCLISLPTLARKCRLSESQTRIAVRNVEARGYVKQLRIEQGARERGIVFEVWTPAESAPVKSTPVNSAPAETVPNKKDLKEQSNSLTCSRCKNTGWWYPEGVARGVKRCDHGAGGLTAPPLTRPPEARQE